MTNRVRVSTVEGIQDGSGATSMLEVLTGEASKVTKTKKET